MKKKNDQVFVSIIGGGIFFHLIAWWILHWFGVDLNALPIYCQLTPTILGMVFGVIIHRWENNGGWARLRNKDEG